jgi:hypothetical protein
MVKSARNVAFVFLVLLSAAMVSNAAPVLAIDECTTVVTRHAWGGQDPALAAEDACNAADCDEACGAEPPAGCGTAAIYGDMCSDGVYCGTWNGVDHYCSSGVCHCVPEY